MRQEKYITPKLAKKLLQLDVCAALVRHVTEASVEALLGTIKEEIVRGNVATHVGSPTSDLDVEPVVEAVRAKKGFKNPPSSPPSPSSSCAAPIGGGGPSTWVVAAPGTGIAVRQEPCTSSKYLGAKSNGQKVKGWMQGNWLRMEGSPRGYMLAKDEVDRELMKPAATMETATVLKMQQESSAAIGGQPPSGTAEVQAQPKGLDIKQAGKDDDKIPCMQEDQWPGQAAREDATERRVHSWATSSGSPSSWSWR